MDVHDCTVCPCLTPGETHCPCLHGRTPEAEKDVPGGSAHTCYCERLAYAHLSSTASGCPRVSPPAERRDEDEALGRMLWRAYTYWEEGDDFGEHMVRAIRGSGWVVTSPDGSAS